jgi:hypothetical protein
MHALIFDDESHKVLMDLVNSAVKHLDGETDSKRCIQVAHRIRQRMVQAYTDGEKVVIFLPYYDGAD